MKKLLYILMFIPIGVFGQVNNPCFSINEIFVQIESENPTITKNFIEGWNMFGYPCSQPLDLIEGFSSIVDKVIIVKDNSGSVYMPEFSFNGIGFLEGGEGYQIKMSDVEYDFSFCEIINWPNLEGCTDCEALNFNQWANVDDGTCNYDSDDDGVLDSEEVFGCLNQYACNYDNLATEDGECEYPENGYNCAGDTLISYSMNFDFDFTFEYQEYIIPAFYDSIFIEAYGAKGGDGGGYSGGGGAYMSGYWSVSSGDTLQVIVGQKGNDGVSTGSGGGGTGVLINGELQIIAGGGGGVDSQDWNYSGLGATTSLEGNSGSNSLLSAGAPGENGGNTTYEDNIAFGGKGFNAGVLGSIGNTSFESYPIEYGTFGLGGGGGSVGEGSCNCGGGGGGYSGGGAGGVNRSGGGGGSFNVGAHQNNYISGNWDHGMVRITFFPNNY